MKIFSHYFIYYVGKCKEKFKIINGLIDILKNRYTICDNLYTKKSPEIWQNSVF